MGIKNTEQFTLFSLVSDKFSLLWPDFCLTLCEAVSFLFFLFISLATFLLHIMSSFKTVFLRYIARPESAETGEKCTVGSFSQAYVQFNNGQEVEIDWSSQSRPLRALYKVSRSWTNFSFHQPTREDVESYWKTNFPPVMKPLMKLLNFPSTDSPFSCCRCMSQWLRWLYMRWLPPRQLDTGHGLQLINT